MNNISKVISPELTNEILSLYKDIRRHAVDSMPGSLYREIKWRVGCGFTEDFFKFNPFGLHPLVMALQTSKIAYSEIGLKNDALIACVLKSCIKMDEENQQEYVKKTFGQNVYGILHGLSKINELYKKNASIQSENFRNLLISFAEDMRVVLLMIADRVNLMRQIKDVGDVESRQKVAMEAAYLYAPLAHKLGLYKLKSELEDLSLKYLEHDAYYHIKEKLNATKRARDQYIATFIDPIQRLLTEAGLSFHMKGRTKSIHSIWQKMKKQHCPFEGVYDLFAIRIILDAPINKEKQQCWQVYSIITDKYQPNPKRLRDWLSIPKSNGYESLHITVLGPENKWVEVQIRTQRMDDIAEHGLAAHWRYKGVKTSESGIDEWLGNIRNALENNDDLQLMDQFKTGLYEDEIYVFSPKGDVFKMAKGATVLDFAYLIHSKVGNQCVGGRINGRNSPMRMALASGDQVEILTNTTQTPKQEWLNIVTTSHAKAKIRQALKEVQAKESVFAKELLERKFKNRKIEWDETSINHLVKKMGYKELSEFFTDIAKGVLDVNEVIEQYIKQYRRDNDMDDRVAARSAENYSLDIHNRNKDTGASNEDVLVIDRNLKGLDFSLAKCCHPIYGDDVFGFVTVHGGIKIHRCDCPNAIALKERFGYRIVKARWAGKGGCQYPISLRVVGNDDIGIVNNLTSIISKESHLYLRSINIESHDGLFSGILTIMVEDLSVLNSLIKKMKTVKGVKMVSRG